jgi:hypothetical protein
VLREVPQDPHLYFNDTEPTHSVRLWTHGWDLFAPARNVIWHCYGPSKPVVRAPWADGGSWQAAVARSNARARHLLGLASASSAEPLSGLDRYGLGSLRTVAEYEAFAGIRFASRRIEPRARRGVCEPRHARPRA